MTRPRSVAINVGANTNEPGFRGPLRADGSFQFVPIPESEPTTRPVPTYADLDLDLPFSLPDDVAERPVHFDPEFPELGGARYTYGDPHGVKARPLLDLSAGDLAFFYATLDTASDDPPDWQPPDWGVYLVGVFWLAADPWSAEDYRTAAPVDRARYRSNAHAKRETFDAAVLLRGDPAASRLFDIAIPLSTPTAGTEPNRLVTELSADSGKGPWWRRPLRFDAPATEALLSVVARAGHDDPRP